MQREWDSLARGAAGALTASLSSFTGPDRKLFLPGGLLDPSEVPAYLNGTLPGE